jgi:hypothetical protein
MRIWSQKIKDPQFGVCEVREMTDREVCNANKKNINWAPKSHGFVNLFKNGKFIAWCGCLYAEEHIIKTKQTKKQMSKYLTLRPNDEHLINIIKWLIDEVRRSGGDGDGLWYSKIYSMDDIKQFILDNNLLPDYWRMDVENGVLSLGDNQEWLMITNDKYTFETRPPWTQVTLEW